MADASIENAIQQSGVTKAHSNPSRSLSVQFFVFSAAILKSYIESRNVLLTIRILPIENSNDLHSLTFLTEEYTVILSTQTDEWRMDSL
jgi:hypothetical protein